MSDAAGASFGIEEEYHLVDPETFALRTAPALSRRALDGAAGPRLRAEMLTSQLEAATDVCRSAAEGRAAVLAMRREAADAAAGEGATILATSTHPFASLGEVDVMVRERYERLTNRFGSVVRAFNLCGLHVHVSVPDLDTAVAVMTAARAYLPLLNALTGSSPFHEGIDTGYASFRMAWLALWQQGGPPPALRSAADYLALVENLVATGLVDEPSELLWELRPSSRYPTLEFRVGDVCPDIDDVMLFAALVRSLVRTLAARAPDPPAGASSSDAVLRAARWRAARYGLTDTLWSPAAARLVPAPVAVEELLGELRPDLEEHDEYAEVADSTARLLAKGTSAAAQRERYAASGDLRDVVRDLVALTRSG